MSVSVSVSMLSCPCPCPCPSILQGEGTIFRAQRLDFPPASLEARLDQRWHTKKQRWHTKKRQRWAHQEEATSGAPRDNVGSTERRRFLHSIFDLVAVGELYTTLGTPRGGQRWRIKKRQRWRIKKRQRWMHQEYNVSTVHQEKIGQR